MARADLATALRAYLLADETLAELVGDRLAPDYAPRELPSAKYAVITDRPYELLEGPSTLRRARVQYDAYATTRLAADAIGEAIEERLAGASGKLGGLAGGAETHAWVDEITCDNNYPRDEPPRDGSDEPLYRRVVDFEVHYQREAPA